MKFKVLIAVLLIATTTVATSALAGARAEKVDVCHDGDNGWEKINVAEQAFAAHVDHGDASPGDPVPGATTGEVFDENCVPTAPPPPPTVDVCPNIDGVQETLPPGYRHDSLGRCITVTYTQPYVVSNCRFDDGTKTSGLADVTMQVGFSGEGWATWSLAFLLTGPFGPLPPAIPGVIGTHLDPGGQPFEVAIHDIRWTTATQMDLHPLIAWGSLHLFLADGTQNYSSHGVPFLAPIPQLCGATLPPR